MTLTIELSSAREKMQDDVIYRFLTNSYWAKGRSYEIVKRSLDNSMCFGAFVKGSQVGFARVISDLSTFAYLADVFVVPEHQGHGIGKIILRSVFSHPALQELRLFLLKTMDAHSLYEQFGFLNIPDPDRYMAIAPPTPTATGQSSTTVAKTQ